MQEVTIGDVAEYYKLSVTNLGDYTAEDFHYILVNGIYKELPDDVSLVLFKCLYRYMKRVMLCEKGGYIDLSNWSYEERDYNTGKYTIYKYNFKPRIPFNRLDNHIYIDFLNHYIKVQVGFIMGTVLKTKLTVMTYGNKKKPYTTVEHQYRGLMKELTEMGFWLLGKKEADKLFEKATESYLKGLHDGYSEEEYAHVNMYIPLAKEDYRLMRARTRINKRFEFPEDYKKLRNSKV